MLHGDSILIAIHRFLCANQGFEVQDAAFAARELNLDAVLYDLIELAHRQNFPETPFDERVRALKQSRH